jgi:hypothetical protein
MPALTLDENAPLPSFVGELNRGIENTVERYAQAKILEWRRMALRRMRREMGYHPVYSKAAGFKSFDAAQFDRETSGWDPDIDGTLVDLGELLPDDNDQPSHPVEGMLENISAVLTRVLQHHLRQHHGDEIVLGHGRAKRKVDNINVLVTSRPHEPGGRYMGIYRPSWTNDEGREITLLEIVVDRYVCNDALRQQVISIIAGEKVDQHLSDLIANSFIHEYSHLMQDIRGHISSLKLIPGTTNRQSSWKYDEEPEHYLSATAEIDAHAAGAAAEVVNRLINQHSQHQPPGWKPEDILDDDWNDDIMRAINAVSKGQIPKDEYAKYIWGLDRRFKSIDPRIKEKYLTKVRHRFIRSYVVRLRRYLRPRAGQPPVR